jgi:hypothetical protein
MGETAASWPKLRRHRSVAFLLWAFPVFLLASPAAAGPDPRELEARTACLAGDYAKGVTLLSQLFVSTRNPTHIYNQGRCFEQNARYRDAVSRFQEYLRVAKDEPVEERAEAQRHIADCRASLLQESGGSTPPPPSPPPVTVTTVPPSPPPVVQPVSQPRASEPAHRAGSGLRIAGITTAAAGGAALIAGIVLNAKVNSMASDFEKYNGYTDSRESERKSYETWGWVSYGVGAACIGTGAVLYFLGARAGRGDSPAVAVLPTSGGATLLVGGAL